MRIDEDHTSAEMERLRVRRLWRAFAGGSDPNGPRSMLGPAAGVVCHGRVPRRWRVRRRRDRGVRVGQPRRNEREGGRTNDDCGTDAIDAAGAAADHGAATAADNAAADNAAAGNHQPPPPPPPEQVGVAVSATEWWTDTGVDVFAGDVVRVEATGTIFAAVGDPRTEVGPDGNPNPEFAGANRDEHGVQVGGGHGALIGTLSRDRPPFLIGAANTLRIDRDGHLFLSVNDGGLDNNSGQFEVTLTIRRAAGS